MQINKKPRTIYSCRPFGSVGIANLEGYQFLVSKACEVVFHSPGSDKVVAKMDDYVVAWRFAEYMTFLQEINELGMSMILEGGIPEDFVRKMKKIPDAILAALAMYDMPLLERKVLDGAIPFERVRIFCGGEMPSATSS